jgi:DNA-binding MarR family transcriptional regulator
VDAVSTAVRHHGPVLDTPASGSRFQVAYEVIYDSNLLMQELAHHLGRHQLTPTTMGVLSCLMAADGGPIRMKELGGRLGMSSSGVTRAVDKLDADGLIDRTGGVDDRREVMVRLTPDGRRRVNEALPGYPHIIDRHRREAVGRGQPSRRRESITCTYASGDTEKEP